MLWIFIVGQISFDFLIKQQKVNVLEVIFRFMLSLRVIFYINKYIYIWNTWYIIKPIYKYKLKLIKLTLDAWKLHFIIINKNVSKIFSFNMKSKIITFDDIGR